MVLLRQLEVGEGGVGVGEDGGDVEWFAAGGLGVGAQLVERPGGRPGLAVVAEVEGGAGLDEKPEHREARFLSDGRQGGYSIYRFHVSIIVEIWSVLNSSFKL